MENRLKVGDWVKGEFIGLGFYEIVAIDEFHVKAKCLRIFGGKNPHYKNHVTCLHHGSDKETGLRIKIDQDKWFSRKVKRRQILST